MHIYIYIYNIYIYANVIIKAVFSTIYHHNGFVVTHGFGHMMYG